MANIIVVFAKIEEAKSIKNILVRNGMNVTAVCTSGAQALSHADEFQDGIIISGHRLTDMPCVTLYGSLPEGFELLVIASQRALAEISGTGIMGLSMPLKVHELINTVDMMVQALVRRKKKRRETPKSRTQEDAAIILQAKRLLMERNNMTEEEAHRYIQKHSMDNGVNMVETAQMVLSVML